MKRTGIPRHCMVLWAAGIASRVFGESFERNGRIQRLAIISRHTCLAFCRLMWSSWSSASHTVL